MNLKRGFDTTNISAAHTGLKGIVYFGSKVSRHKPGIEFKPSGSDEVISFFIEDGAVVAPKEGVKLSSRDLKKVVEWIALNKENLLKHWNDRDSYTSADFILEMKSVNK